MLLHCWFAGDPHPPWRAGRTVLGLAPLPTQGACCPDAEGCFRRAGHGGLLGQHGGGAAHQGVIDQRLGVAVGRLRVVAAYVVFLRL